MSNTLTIHQYFKGMRQIKKYSAKDVANVLGITADDLLAFEMGKKTDNTATIPFASVLLLYSQGSKRAI